MANRERKCKGCKEHNQFLTPETWLIVQQYKAEFNKEHPRANGIVKSDAVNNIITEWKQLKDAKNSNNQAGTHQP